METRCQRVLLGVHPLLCKTKSSWKTTLKTLRVEGEGYLVTSVPIEAKQGNEIKLSTKAQQLLEKFDDIFQVPKGLPLRREHDHAVVLKEDAAIPCM